MVTMQSTQSTFNNDVAVCIIGCGGEISMMAYSAGIGAYPIVDRVLHECDIPLSRWDDVVVESPDEFASVNDIISTTLELIRDISKC